MHCIEVAIWNGHRSIISLTKNLPYAAFQQHLWLIKISKIVKGTSPRHKLCPSWRCTFKKRCGFHPVIILLILTLPLWISLLLFSLQENRYGYKPCSPITLEPCWRSYCVLLEYRNDFITDLWNTTKALLSLSHKHLLLISFYEGSWLCLDFTLISATTRVLPHSR